MPEDYVADQSPRTQRLISEIITVLGLTEISGGTGNIYNPDLTSFYEVSTTSDDPTISYLRLDFYKAWLSAGITVDIQLKSSSASVTAYAKLQISYDDTVYTNIGSTVSTTSTDYISFELSGWIWAFFRNVKICIWSSTSGSIIYAKIRNAEIIPYLAPAPTEQFPPALTDSLNFKVAVQEALPTGTNSIGKVTINSATTAYSGQKNVTTAGSHLVLGTTQAIVSITVTAKPTNTGNIFVGPDGVTSTTGLILQPGDSVSLDVSNVTAVYIDSAVSGEGVSWLAIG